MRHAFVVVLLASLLSACAAEENLPGPDVVARLGGREVRHADFAAYLTANLGETGAALESDALSALFDRFVEERLLSQLAEDRRLIAGRASAARAVDALLAADPAPPITETALLSYYAEHGDDFREPERVELRVIRTDDRIAAERARRELRAGVPFATVAERLSVDPTAAQGGEQGTLAHDDLPPSLADAVFRLAAGQVSDILTGDDGFYLFRLERRIPPRIPELAEVRDEIRRRLVGARADRALARFLAEARSRYAVEVFDRNLPFVYHGEFPVSRPYEKR